MHDAYTLWQKQNKLSVNREIITQWIMKLYLITHQREIMPFLEKEIKEKYKLQQNSVN